MSTQQPRSWEASSSESDCSASEGSEETRKADSSKNSDSDIRLSQSLRGSQQQQSGKDMAKTPPPTHIATSGHERHPVAAGPMTRQLDPCIPHASAAGRLKHGYFYSIKRQCWLPSTYVEGRQIVGEPCQSEAEVQVKAIELHNEQHPGSPAPAAAVTARTAGTAAAAAAAAGAGLRRRQRYSYRYACRLPRASMSGYCRGYSFKRRDGRFRVSILKDGAAHDGGSHSSEREAADAAWYLHLRLTGSPADTAAPPLLLEAPSARKTVAQKGHMSLKQAPQQQQQSGKCMYMPRIPRKDHHGRLRGYHPKKAAFVVSLWAHGRQEYGGSHATEEEAADAAWQLYLNLQGLPRDTPALPLQRMRPGTPRKPVAPSREGDTAAQAKYDYAYAPRVFEEGTPAKRGYTWRAASRAFFPSLRVQGEYHGGQAHDSEEAAAHAAFRLYLDHSGVPADTPEPPLLPAAGARSMQSKPQKASVAVCPSYLPKRSKHPYQYAARLFPGSVRPVQGYYHLASAHGAKFQPCINLDGVLHRGSWYNTEREAADASFKLYAELHGLPSDAPAPPLLLTSNKPLQSAKPTPPAAPQAAKKTKYPFVFAPRHFGHGYRPMRAYATRLMGGKLVFRPVICKDGERHTGGVYKSERDAANAAWALFRTLFKLPAEHPAPPLLPTSRTTQKRASSQSPASSPSPPKKRRLDSSTPDEQACETQSATPALYRLPPGVLAANGGLKRGYYHTADSAGNRRWVVDMTQQAADGGAPLGGQHMANNEGEAAELAQQICCKLTGLSRQRLREEVTRRAHALMTKSAPTETQSMQQQSQPWRHTRPPASNAAHQRSQRIILQSLQAKRKRQQQSSSGNAAKKHLSELQAMHRERSAPVTRSLDQPSRSARNIRSPARGIRASQHQERMPAPAEQPQQDQQLTSPQQATPAHHATGPNLAGIARPGLHQAVPQLQHYHQSDAAPSCAPRIPPASIPVWPDHMQQEQAASQPASTWQALGPVLMPQQHADTQPQATQLAAPAKSLPQQLSTSLQPQLGAAPAPQADHGGSSATNEPAAGSAPAADKAGMRRELEVVCEQLLDAAGCAKAFEGVLQAKLRAAKRRAEDKAVEDILDDVKSMSAAEVRQVLDQRRQDLAKIEAYAQGLNGVIASLS